MAGRAHDDAPLPLITFERNKYDLGKQALDMISWIQGPIGVIAVAGLYRTGKSYLLNRLLGRQKGFDVGPTVNPCTKGIYVWGKPIKGTSPSGEPITFLIIDTEGLGSTSADQTHDAKIFSLAILLSSFFIYNSMGTIDETALDKLSLVLNLTQHIHLRAKGGKDDEQRLAAYFPAFLWVVRDFTLQLKDEDGNDISEKEYLERALTERSGTSDQVQSKNRIRRSIRTFFTNRDCTTLVRPVSDERQLQNIDSLPAEKLRDEFRKKMDRIKDRVFNSTPMKMQDGIALNGAGFAALVRAYVDALNKGAVPSLQDGWQSAVIVQCTKALGESVAEFERFMKSKWDESRPIDDATLDGHIRAARDRAQEHFASNALGDRDHSFAKQLQQKIDEEVERLKRANAAHSSKRCEEFLRNAFSSFQQDMENGKYHTQKQLLDAWRKLEAEYNKATAAASDKARKETWEKYVEKFHAQILPQFAQQEKDRHEKELKAAEARAAELREKQHQTELNLQAELANSENWQQKFERAESDRKALEKKVERLEAEVSRLQKEKEALERELKSHRTDADKETRSRQQKIDILTSEKRDLEAELARERTHKGNVDTDLARERSRISKLEKEAHEATGERDAKARDVTRLERELNNARDEVAQLRSELQEKVDELSAAHAARHAVPEAPAPAPAAAPAESAPEPSEPEEAHGGEDDEGGRPKKRAAPGSKKPPTSKKPKTSTAIEKLTVKELKELLIKANVKPPVTAKAKADYVQLCNEHFDKVEPFL